MAPPSTAPHWRGRHHTTPGEGGIHPIIDLEKLAWASLACWQDTFDGEARPVLEGGLMPHQVREQPLVAETDPPLMEEQFSLFRMARIRNVNLARIRVICERISGGGPVKCRHQVKEFWRWQACGEGFKERRWTKVNGHMRGHGTPTTLIHVIATGNL